MPSYLFAYITQLIVEEAEREAYMKFVLLYLICGSFWALYWVVDTPNITETLDEVFDDEVTKKFNIIKTPELMAGFRIGCILNWITRWPILLFSDIWDYVNYSIFRIKIKYYIRKRNKK